MPRHGSAAPGAEVDAGSAPPRRRSIARWPIRRKLTLLVMIPLIALVAGGSVVVTQFALDYRQARLARIYADAVLPALQVSQAITNEFTTIDAAGMPVELRQARSATDDEVKLLRSVLADLADADASTNLPSLAATVDEQLETLPNKRALVEKLIQSGSLNTDSDQVRAAVQMLSVSIQELIAGLTGELSKATPDRDTTARATAVTNLARASRDAASEQALLTDLITKRANGPEYVTRTASEIAQVVASQNAALDAAALTVVPDQSSRVTSIKTGDQSLQDWRRVPQDVLLNPEEAETLNLQAWNAVSGDRATELREMTNDAAEDLRATARGAETSTLVRAALIAVFVLILIGVVAVLLASIARSVTVPLRRLRSGAVEVASVQLPAAVARIEQDGSADDIELAPVLPADAAAGPETVEVARAVDELSAEAVRLATAQVRLRRALDEAFVSMSRRSQAMVEKQLTIIDQLESQEQDPDQLRNLFRLDHLAARMRRYNDNLLVLAGSAVRTRATAPIRVAELFRAATSEMDQYERVRLQPVTGASVSGTVAGELVHLLAELLDNAAMFSPPTSPIVLSGSFTPDGGLQIEVVDGGVGIGSGELDRINSRLSQPETIDTQVPSRMGLFVVARLARRGGFAVQLMARPDTPGTIALVRVPPALVGGAPSQSGGQPLVTTGSRPGGVAGLPQRDPQQSAFARPPGLEPVGQSDEAPSGAPGPPGTPVPPAQPTGPDRLTPAASGIVPADGEAPLPRRRKPPRTSTPPGLPPAAIAAAANVTPPGGLFTPLVPVDGEQDQDAEQNGVARAETHPRTSPNGVPVRTGEPADPSDADADAGDASEVSPSAETPPRGVGRGATAWPGRNGAGANGTDAQPLITRGSPSAKEGANSSVPERGTGAAPAAWDGDLPTELVARAAAASSYRPADPDAPMIGDLPQPGIEEDSPIFDSISVWFADNPTGGIPVQSAGQDGEESDDESVIDLRERSEPSSRWSSLGDQRWLATNARASAAPDTAGTTDTGLPKRRPGANLLPSASAAAAPATGQTPAPPVQGGSPERSGDRDRTPAPAPAASSARGAEPGEAVGHPDADEVRGRLGGYQRGLATARRARTQEATPPTFDAVGANLFTANREPGDDAGKDSGDQEGDT